MRLEGHSPSAEGLTAYRVMAKPANSVCHGIYFSTIKWTQMTLRAFKLKNFERAPLWVAPTSPDNMTSTQNHVRRRGAPTARPHNGFGQ